MEPLKTGQKSVAKIRMINDLSEDGLGISCCANKGDELVIRKILSVICGKQNYAVSHENVTDSAFCAFHDELSESK